VKKNNSIYNNLNWIQQRLFAFSLILVMLALFNAANIKGKIHKIVDKGFEKTLQREHFSRELGILGTRLGVFRYQVYNDTPMLEIEGKAIGELITHLYEDSTDSKMQTKLHHLEYNLLLYQQQWRSVNHLLSSRTELDQSIEGQFQAISEMLTDRMAFVAPVGNDDVSLRQLSKLIAGCYKDFLNIAKLGAEENIALFYNKHSKYSPALELLKEVKKRLAIFTVTVSPLEQLVTKLVDSIDYYQLLLRNYGEEIDDIAVYDLRQQELVTDIYAIMGSLDVKLQQQVANTGRQINFTINIAVAILVVALLLISLLSWLSYRKIFKKHIQEPLGLIRQCLWNFEQGDHSSLMSLDRNDEWGEVEIVFNQMIVTLDKNLSALKKSEKRYRDNFDNSPDGLFHISVSGKVLKINRALIGLFGFNANFSGAVPAKHSAYTMGLIDRGYCHPADREKWIELLRQNHVVNDFEVEFNHLNGGTFWGSISGHLVAGEDGKEGHVEGAIRDITKQKKAHETLQQLQLYLQNIIDSMPSILIGVDNKMIVTMWNQRAVEESLLAAKDAKGYTMEKVCHLFDLNAFMPQLEKTLKTRQPIWLHKVESKKKTKTGSRRFFDIMIYPVTDEGAAGAVIYMIDTTEKLQMEEMVVRSEKMQSIGGLAAGLAHEINNPLAVVLQNVQVLDRRLSPNLSKNCQVAEELGTTMETIAEYAKLRGCEQVIHSIAEAGHRVAKIVANIQSFSRSGTSTLIPCSIIDLIERTLDLVGSDHDMRNNFDFKKISIVRDFNEVADVCCEPSQIQQVFLSLLKNAAQALIERKEGQEIILRIAPVDVDHIRVQICDNGMGMASEVTNRIFDPFFTTQDVGAGFGLGLSVAYFIITHNHGGSLKVTSELGAGSCFEIILPLIQNEDDK